MPTPRAKILPRQYGRNAAARTVILHLAVDLEPDDPGRETVDLAMATQRSGWRALIASSGGQLVKMAERAAVRHRRLPLDGNALFSDWRSRLLLEAIIQKERPAVVHAHGADTLLLAQGLAKIHRFPLIADLTQPIPVTPRYRKLFEVLKQLPGRVRVPSEYMARHLCDQFGYPSDKIVHIPPGVDLSWFGAGFVSPERLRKLSHLWRLPEQASVVLVPLPLAPEMGHQLFLEALTQLKQENIFAVLVGSDRHAPGYAQQIENLLTRYNLNSRVVMPEVCLDWPAACWMASVIVTPNTEPRGQIPELLAAQAIGRPVIVTDTGASTEMVRSGETAWVIPPNDVKALTAAMREAITMTTEQRLNVAANTHDFVAETFPQSAWFNSMMDMYDSQLRPVERTVRAQQAA